MDLWVVAAAAGAGYVAKHLQNLPSSEKGRLGESSSKFSTPTSPESKNFLQQIRDRTCPLRRLAQETVLRDASSEQKDAAVKEDYNVLWLSSLPPKFSGRESILRNVESVKDDCSPFELGKFKSLRSRTPGNFITPSSSRQSLPPQLYKEHEKVEEYVYSSVPSPCILTMRPLLITEGTEIMSRSNGIPTRTLPNDSKETIKSDACWNEKNASLSDPSPHNTNSVELHSWTSGSAKRVSSKASHSLGSPKSMLLLMIGVIIGIISTVIANENKVARLNEQLKRANNFVQDLQEELEMKDKLTVKDLAYEDSQPLSIKNHSLFNYELIPSVTEPRCNEPEAREIDSCITKTADARTAEDPSLRSQIEAELKAELEKLELNMKTSVLDRASGFTELDLESEADIIQEDTKLNLLGRQYDDDSPEVDYDEERGTATEKALPPNYAVSPRQLTIHLRELIESRLEARIKELETALQNSQNRLQSLESECITSRDIASAQESPACGYN